MLVLTVQATAFAASCYIVASAPGEPCLVLDPGAGTAAAVERLVGEHGLAPVAVAASHGHPDHIWDAAALVARWDVPFYLGQADLDRLADPAGALGRGLGEMFAAMAGSPWHPPAGAEPYPEASLDVLPGLPLAILPAPGHTPGSTVLVAPGASSSESALPPTVTGRPLPATSAVAFTGDVLFAGSVGRVDLPGGDGPTMAATLSRLLETLPAGAWLLPGHGPISTLGVERARNPYLAPAWLARGAF